MTKRIYIDNGLLSELCQDKRGVLNDSFLDICGDCNLNLENRRVNISNDWSSFLEFIGSGRIMDEVSLDFPELIKQKFISYFNLLIPMDLEEVNQLIDIAYSDCLSTCQNIKILESSNLITLFHEKHKRCEGEASKFLIPIVAGRYVESIKLDPQGTNITICCNLSWELLSIRLASLIAQTSTKKYPLRILKLFQPLISVYHKICIDHGNQPNLFRLMEASYLSIVGKQTNMPLEMLKRLQNYKRKYQTRSKGDLGDCSYLDAGMIGHLDICYNKVHQFPVTVFTLDKPEQVLHRLSLFRYMLEKLQKEIENWNILPQYASNIICVDFVDKKLKLKDVVAHSILNSFHKKNT